ncbi:MAG: hypothetical protein HQL41_12545, partial [Alphaproteobacteria bacterium]|nr:hypothetical protein [Alphaproteobacteria bacterium]
MDAAAAHRRLACGFAQVEAVLEPCLAAAEAALDPAGVEAWLDGAALICRLG